MSELLANLALGFGVAAQPYNILFCLLGALVGTLVGVLPGIGTVATIAMLLPITFGLPPGGRPDHARRHLLRRAIRRLDHVDPGQHSGRGDVRGHRARRPPDGAAGTRGRRAVDRRDRLVLRRLRGDRAGGGARCAADRPRAAVRAGRILLAHGARPDLRGRAGEGLGAQGGRRDRARPAPVDGRLRSRNRRRPHDLRSRGARRRHRLRQHRHGRVRVRARSSAISNCRRRVATSCTPRSAD